MGALAGTRRHKKVQHGLGEGYATLAVSLKIISETRQKEDETYALVSDTKLPGKKKSNS